jgi:hypothetical protein
LLQVVAVVVAYLAAEVLAVIYLSLMAICQSVAQLSRWVLAVLAALAERIRSPTV